MLHEYSMTVPTFNPKLLDHLNWIMPKIPDQHSNRSVEAFLGNQHLFSYKKCEHAHPSVQIQLHQYCKVWRETCTANCHWILAVEYKPDQKS